MPAVQHRHAVAQIECLLLLVRDEYGGDADPPDHLAQLAPRALAQRRIEIRQRLIEQQHARLGGERARKCDALLLSARELMHLAPLESREIHEGQRCRDFGLDRSLLPAPCQSERDVAADVELGKQGVVLKDHPEAAPCRRHSRNRLIRDRDAAAVRGLEAREEAQHRGLAAAGRAEQGEDFPSRDLERDRSYRHVMVPALLDRSDFEEASQ